MQGWIDYSCRHIRRALIFIEIRDRLRWTPNRRGLCGWARAFPGQLHSGLRCNADRRFLYSEFRCGEGACRVAVLRYRLRRNWASLISLSREL